MDTKTLKEFVNAHPDGVVIRLIDGTRYEIPHRDFIWFTPMFGDSEGRGGRYATSFWISHDSSFKMVNALLVADVTPLKPRGGKGRRRRKSA